MGEGTDERQTHVNSRDSAGQGLRNSTASGDEPYEPIDCTIHDQLIERAAFRLPTGLKVRDESGQVVVTQDMIEDVYSRDGAEYLRLASGTEIRLDKIVDFGRVDAPDDEDSAPTM